MSTLLAPVEIATPLIQTLNQADVEFDAIDDFLCGEQPSEAISRELTIIQQLSRIANATWVPRLIDSDLAAIIQEYLKNWPLQVQRNAFAGTVTLVTPGVLNGLAAEVEQERSLYDQQEPQGFATVSTKTFAKMASEAVVDWTLRMADEGYEVRMCPKCAKWFEPLLRSRSRFCSDKCRKMFNNLRSSNNDDLTSFVCKGCEETRPMDEFAGLRFEDENGKTVTPLRMGYYALSRHNLCCVQCVRAKYTEWRRYIAPMESLSERATA